MLYLCSDMRYLLLLCLPPLPLWAGSANPSWNSSAPLVAWQTTAAGVEPQVAHRKQSFFARLKAKAARFWQAIRLLISDQELIRLLLLVLIVALALSVLMWLLPWPADVLIATVIVIIAIIFLLRYI